MDKRVKPEFPQFNVYRYLDGPDAPSNWHVSLDLAWRHPKAEHFITPKVPPASPDPVSGDQEE